MITNHPWQNSILENDNNPDDFICITISPSQFRPILSENSNAVSFARHILTYVREKTRSSKILILIADEIQKYNVAVFEHKNEQNSLKIARSLGKKITSFFTEAYDELPLNDREKIQIICWNDMITSCDYDSKIEHIRQFINDNQTKSLPLIDEVCKQYAHARNSNRNLKKKELEMLREYVIHELPALLFGIEYKVDRYKLMLHPVLKTNNYNGHVQRTAMTNLLEYMRNAYLQNTYATDLICHIFDIEILSSSIRINDESSIESISNSEISNSNSPDECEPSATTNDNTATILLLILNFQLSILIIFNFWFPIVCLGVVSYIIYQIYRSLIERIARNGQWQSVSDDSTDQFVRGSEYKSFFGDLPCIQSSENGRFMNDLHIKLGCPQVYRIWMGPEPALMLAHPQAVKDFWSKHDEKKVERDVHLGWPLEMLMGSGVGFRSMDDRSRITKYFHTAFGASQVRHFDEQIEQIVEQFFNTFQSDRLTSDDIKYLAHDAAVYLFFGETGFEHLNELHSLVDELRELMIEAFNARWTNLPIIGYYLLPNSYKLRERIRSFNKRIRQVVSRIIDTYRQTSLTGDENMCIAARFASQTNPSITLDELTDTIVEGLLAPNDGTAGTFMYTLLLLGMHPNVQDAIRKEFNDLSDFTLKSLNKINYLDQILSECQRLCPIFMFNVPEFASQSMTVGNVNIPKNTMVMLDVVSLNHNQASWGDDALSFRPERFASPVSPATLKAYHGFGNGHLRRCLGQYLIKNLHKLFLARLLNQKQIELITNHDNVNSIRRCRLPFIYVPNESVKLVQL